jgi:hypothetical protein
MAGETPYWWHTLPAVATGLAQLDQLGLGVAHLADGRLAVEGDLTHLPRGETEQGEIALLGHELNGGAGGAGQLGAAAGTHLDGVNHGARRDVAQWERVAGANVGAGA